VSQGEHPGDHRERAAGAPTPAQRRRERAVRSGPRTPRREPAQRDPPQRQTDRSGEERKRVHPAESRPREQRLVAMEGVAEGGPRKSAEQPAAQPVDRDPGAGAERDGVGTTREPRPDRGEEGAELGDPVGGQQGREQAEGERHAAVLDGHDDEPVEEDDMAREAGDEADARGGSGREAVEPDDQGRGCEPGEDEAEIEGAEARNLVRKREQREEGVERQGEATCSRRSCAHRASTRPIRRSSASMWRASSSCSWSWPRRWSTPWTSSFAIVSSRPRRRSRA